MTEANDARDAITREFNDPRSYNTELETEEEQDICDFREEEASEEIPPSLLSYFETSKSRAAACEKLIHQEDEAVTASHHSEGVKNFPPDPGEEMVTPDEQVICEMENKESRPSADSSLRSAPREPPLAYNVSVCPSDEDETGEEEEEYLTLQEHLAEELNALECSLKEEEKKEEAEYQAERAKRNRVEMEKEEQRRKRDKVFQEELRKIEEAEKIHQRELELMEKRAQETLAQKLLHQQELISNLQRQVEEERKRAEEERKKKEEEQRKKMEEQERKKKEEEERMKKEKENRRKKEEERKKKEEEQRKKMEEERMKKEKEDRRKRDEERKKQEEEDIRKKEEERKKKEVEERIKKEEERKKKEEEERMKKEKEDRIKKDEERKKKEEEERIKKEKEDIRKREAERKKKEQERIKEEEEDRRKKEEERKKMAEEERIQEEEKRKNEKERFNMEVTRKTMVEVMRRKEEEEQKRKNEIRNGEEEKKKEKEAGEWKKKEEDEMIKQEENSKICEEAKKIEAVTKMIEEEKNRQIEEQPMAEEECRKEEVDDDERITKQAERRKRKEKLSKKEEENRKREEDSKKTGAAKEKMEEDVKREEEEESRSGTKEEKERTKVEDEDETRTEEEKRTIAEEEKEKEERKKMEAEKKEVGKEVKKGDTVGKTDEEIGCKGEDGKKKKEEEENLAEENGMRGQEEEDYRQTGDVRLKDEGEREKKLEKEEMRRREEEQRNQSEKKKLMEEGLEEESREREEFRLGQMMVDSTARTSSGPGSSRSAEAVEQAHPDKNISQTEDPAGGPATSPASLSTCLPEHTEQRRLCWMRSCISWSKLSLQNRRKQKRPPPQSRRGARRPADLPPLSPDSLLQSGGWRSLREVTTVTLEDLPGCCSLSTLAQCPRIHSLTVRRCGLKALDGISQLPELRYIDVQENDITFVDCENMSSLRVLRLGRNQLTSIHGLSGVDHLDVLDLSHNCITRITGLESMKRLQRLSVDHNQLISTKGLRDVYTLLHLDCSHNHLTSVEGLENCALLNTLDLSGNSLTEPPCLENQVLLRELRLDDNSISSLQGLAACWLPLMQLLSVAQNSVTQLPRMSDCVSLVNLDLQHNCLSELENVCESLQGCQCLREVHLTGNPLQQERSWRSALQRAVPGLKTTDGQETEAFLSPPAVHQVKLPSGSFLTFCQAQLQQSHDLLQQHSVELSNASSPLDAVKISCRHFAEALQLAEDQRFAQEYGDTVVPDKQRALGQTTPEEKLHTDIANAAQLTERSEMKSPGNEEVHMVPSVIPSGGNVRRYRTSKEKSAERHLDTSGTDTAEPQMERSVTKATKGKTHPSVLRMFNPQELDLKNTAAAVVIQQWWRKHREKCVNINSPPAADKGEGRGGGDGATFVSGPSPVDWSVDQHYAATVIQAFWKGFALRKRLASALSAAAWPDTGEDDTFEEVDVDEFVFDEAALEKDWTLLLSEDSPPISHPASKQPPGVFSQPLYDPLPPPLACRPKQAWAATAGEQVDSTEQRDSPESTNGSKCPTSKSALSDDVSKQLENILEEWGFTDSRTALLMLKRAQKMQSKKQKKFMDPSVHLGLFRNCTYQSGPEEAQRRPVPDKRHYMKVCEAEAGPQRAGNPEQERAQRLHAQAAPSERHSDSRHFLPKISPDVLNRGRVQLTARPGYTEHLHQASGSWANSSSAAQPGKEHNYPRRNSWGHARKEVPSPKQATSAPSIKERISFRDNPVLRSDGWGGGKKRDKVCK